MLTRASFFVSLTTDSRNTCAIAEMPGFFWNFFFHLSDKITSASPPSERIPAGFPGVKSFNTRSNAINGPFPAFPLVFYRTNHVLRKRVNNEDSAISKHFFFRLFYKSFRLALHCFG